MSLNDKMTAIANKIRSILGITGAMGLDDMDSGLGDCQNIVDSQAELLDQAILAIANKSAGSRDPELQSKTAIPSESIQTIMADSGYDGLSAVTINPVDNRYIGSNINRQPEYAYTPGTTDQIIPGGMYLDGDQTILGDINLLPENIRLGSTIFGVNGTFEDGGIDTSDATATPGDIAEGVTCYVNGEKIVGELSDLRNFMNYGTGSSINVAGDIYYRLTAEYPDGGYVPKGGPVSIFTRMSSFGDANPEDVCSGKTFTSSSGVKIGGSAQSVESGYAHDFTDNYPGIFTTDNTKYFSMMAEVSSSTLFKSGSYVEIDTAASNLGSALPGEVMSGKTFTSENGVKITGTYVPPAGLPSGVSKLASGTFKLTSNKATHTISHGLGSTPNFVFVSATGSITDSSYANYVLYHSMICKQVTLYGYTAEIQVCSVSGNSDGQGLGTHHSWIGPADNYFTSSNIILEPSNDKTNFKSGVTYRWVCGTVSV